MEFYRLTVFVCNLLLIMMLLLLGYANVEGSPRLDVVCLEGGVGGGGWEVHCLVAASAATASFL